MRMKAVFVLFAVCYLLPNVSHAQSTSLSYFNSATSVKSFPIPAGFQVSSTSEVPIIGYGERFTSPFDKTYFDSVDVAMIVEKLDTNTGNGIVVAAQSAYVSNGHYGTGSTIFDYDAILPGEAAIGSPENYHIVMSHDTTSKDFFITVHIPDTIHSQLFLISDSVTSSTPLPLNEDRDRSRLYLFNGQEGYLAGTTWGGVSNLYWYPNFAIVAYVSSPTGDVAQIYPAQTNPLNFYVLRTELGETHLHFTTKASDDVQLDLFDRSGRLIATIANAVVAAGEHDMRLGLTTLTNGMYFVRLTTNEGSEVRPVALIR